MINEAWAGRARVVLAPDRPGHWPENPILVRRLRTLLGGDGAGRARVEIVDRTLVRRCEPGRTRWYRVSASHEDSWVGVALTRSSAVGFDLCGDARARSARSALPLVLDATERPLLGQLDACPADEGRPAAVTAWTSVEALTKYSHGRLLSPRSRVHLTSLAPPRCSGVSLLHAHVADLTACVAVPAIALTPQEGSTCASP